MENNFWKVFFVRLMLLIIPTSGFIFIKWDSFVDLTTNLIKYRDSHPFQIISFDKLLDSLEKKEVIRADFYENAEIVVFDIFDSIDQKLKHVGVLCSCCIQTLFLEHAVGFLNLGLFFKPKSPAVEDLRHSVFDFLWRPRAKVLLKKDQQGQSHDWHL